MGFGQISLFKIGWTDGGTHFSQRFSFISSQSVMGGLSLLMRRFPISYAGTWLVAIKITSLGWTGLVSPDASWVAGLKSLSL